MVNKILDNAILIRALETIQAKQEESRRRRAEELERELWPELFDGSLIPGNESIYSVATTEVAEAFIEYKDSIHLADATIERYSELVRRFARDNQHWPNKPEIIENYLGQFSPTNHLNHFNVLSMLFRFGSDRYSLPNTMAKVKRPKVKEKPMPTLFPEEAKKVEENLADSREKAVYALGYGMGFRAREIRELKFADIRGDTMVVHGKERDEIVPLLSKSVRHFYY